MMRGFCESDAVQSCAFLSEFDNMGSHRFLKVFQLSANSGQILNQGLRRFDRSCIFEKQRRSDYPVRGGVSRQEAVGAVATAGATMDRHPVRTMSTSGAELNPRPFRVRQHDIDVFYALVGGGKNAAKSKDESQVPAEPAAGTPAPQSPPDAPARPVRRGPPSSAATTTVAATSANATTASVAAAAVDATDVVAATPDGGEVTGIGPAAWAAALNDIAPAPRRVSRARAKPVRRSQVSWSPKVLCQHLVNRVDQLHVDSWVRKMSGDAMRRLGEAQSRLNGSRPKQP